MSSKLYGLFYAALHRGQLKKIKSLIITEGVSLDYQFGDGAFPLHIAAERGYAEVVELLLSLSADINSKNQHGEPALLVAARYSREEVVTLLLRRPGCKVNLTDSHRRGALHVAAAKGLLGSVERLLTSGAAVNVQDRWGRSPLHVTLLSLPGVLHNPGAVDTYCKVAQVLIAHRSHVNVMDKQKSTPLFLAVAAGDCCLEVVRHLVESGAKVNTPSRHRLTPIALAAMKGYTHLAGLLIWYNCAVAGGMEPRTGKSCLRLAIERQDFTLARLLVQAGFPVHEERWLFTAECYHFALAAGGKTTDPACLSFRHWLVNLARYPLSLSQLSRSILRRYLGTQIHAKLKKLSYPEPLKKFLLLQNDIAEVIELDASVTQATTEAL